MRILLAVCAFSTFTSSVFCQIHADLFIHLYGSTEGLFYDRGQLFWIDVMIPQICSRHDANGAIVCAILALERVHFAAPIVSREDVFVVGSDTEILLVHWNSHTNVFHPPMTRLRVVCENTAGQRINHGKVDPQGRLWVGTVNHLPENFWGTAGNVHSIDVATALRTHIRETIWSQGIVWDMFSNIPKCYYVDAMSFQVVSYDYNQGRLTNKHVVYDLLQHGVFGLPGNLAIDDRGNLWVPLFGHGQVIEINPHAGTSHRIIEVGASKTIGCTFGGPELEVLYIATKGYGHENVNEQRPPHEVYGGSIFAVRDLGVRGRPLSRYVLTETYIPFPH